MPRGFLQRIVARHVEPMAIRPHVPARFPHAAAEISQPLAPSVPPMVSRSVPTRGGDHAAPPADIRPVRPAASSEPDDREGPMPSSPVADGVHQSSATTMVLPVATGSTADAPAAKPTEPRLPVRRVVVTQPPIGGDDARSAAPVAVNAGHADEGRAAARASRSDDTERSVLPGRAARNRLPVTRATAHDGRSDEAETIHVHIDRIDVRAVMPAGDRAPAPRPRSTAAQPLSLDDYLTQRSRR
jgi:hypothetical protein